jgi:serine protease Do
MNTSDNKPLITFLILVGFLSGIIGGIGGMAVLATSSSLQKAFGISTNNGGITFPDSQKVEKISVQEDSSVISAVKKVSPAVVSVAFTKDVQVFNPLGGQGQSVQQSGGGSGFIITSDGLVATNKHVASLEGASYSVITQDGKKYDAKVLALDPINDFAILKIEAKNLPTVEFGSSDDLDIGQRVIAIGNALGEFENTVTVGVLSGKERTISASSSSSGQGAETLYGLLQTDAAINEGNSGGPLINLKGQVVGINTATAAKGQAEGLGFAIPINTLKSAVDSVEKTGKIVRPYIGIRYLAVDQKIAALKGMDEAKGILVYGDPANNVPAVVPESPADKAGIKQGDVILKVNNDQIDEKNSLTRLLSKYNPGNEVDLTVKRDSNTTNIRVKLGESSS